MVYLTVYNSQGERISTLINEYKQAGNYIINFDGTDIASGIYFYKLETKYFIHTKKMLLIK